jgi:SAM-dependent methyltransferase
VPAKPIIQQGNGMTNSLSDNIVSLYERNANAWHKRRNPLATLEASWLERFISELPLGGDILDRGCGTGRPIASWLAHRGFAITGVDSSEAMLAHAREMQPGQTWVRSDMRALKLDSQFAGLLAWDSFFHLNADDQRRMFAVFQAHAKSGAMLMFTSGPAESEAIGEFEGEPLFHASLSPQEYRSLLAQHGFDVIDFVPEDPTCGQHSVWLARHRD